MCWVLPTSALATKVTLKAMVILSQTRYHMWDPVSWMSPLRMLLNRLPSRNRCYPKLKSAMRERSGTVSWASFMALHLLRFVEFSRRRHAQAGERCAGLRGRRQRNQTSAIARTTPVAWGGMFSSDPDNPSFF